MSRKRHIARHTEAELAAVRARGESRTHWAKSAAMTQAELEASIAADGDEAGMVVDWDEATIEMPQPKAVLNMRIDRDVLEFFKRTGRGYQTRINAVLRAFVEAQEHRPR